MAEYRIPGHICSTLQPWDFDEGTNALRCTPPAGHICSELENYPSGDLQEHLEPEAPDDVSFLFDTSLNPDRGISDKAYKDAAETLGVEIATIKAVAQVETAGEPFDEDGRPRILYERHIFRKRTGGKFSKAHPKISGSAGGYTKDEYTRLKEAYDLDESAALESASWGRFQIMGFNYDQAGYDSVEEFVMAMTESEENHLEAFVTFVGASKAMKHALAKKEWAKFAAAYNGPNYADNKYDTKMEAAYKKFAPPPPPPPPKPIAKPPTIPGRKLP